LFAGPKVTLQQVLDNRERRVSRQQKWVKDYSLPLISFTINMMGEIKRNKLSQIAFERGYIAILEACRTENLSIISIEKFSSVTGVELLISVESSSVEVLKRRMVNIEDEHPLGRLFDIDVVDNKGVALSRDNLRLARRPCLLCDRDAKVCARSRNHALSELKQKMSEMINDCEQLDPLVTQ